VTENRRIGKCFLQLKTVSGCGHNRALTTPMVPFPGFQCGASPVVTIRVIAVSFDELLRKLRRGDVDVVEEFVATYDSFIRRAIRPRIKRANLGAVADSVDICQSVLGSFLIRLAAGEYELNSQQDLQNLLFSIARNKFAFLVRREYADRRDRNRNTTLQSGQFRLIADSDNPQQNAQRRDLIEHVRSQLTAEDRELFRRRQEGQNWDEIALQVGGSAVLLRKRFSRALNVVAAELGFEERDG
jgi:DNA-directed RNA polymerase specialized sigma24 family protein